MNQESTESQKNRNWRVKVYVLNTEGEWHDCGAGFLEIVSERRGDHESLYLKVRTNPDLAKSNPPKAPIETLKKLGKESEEDYQILNLPVLADSSFEIQDDSIITWIDHEIKEEIAISFLDLFVMNETWNSICRVLQRNPSLEYCRELNDIDELPIPTIGNLEHIRNELESKKHWISKVIEENKSFLPNLAQIFSDLEVLESQDIYRVNEIMKIIVFSADTSLLETLLSDEYIMFVFGALEYESDPISSTRPKYREFLQNQANFKQVIEFQSEDILKMIQLNFRINFLKDSITSSIIDDPLSNEFMQISYYTNHVIFEHIMENGHYFDELFAKIQTNMVDVISFLSELTQIVKNLVQIEKKEDYARKLVEKDIFEVIAKTQATLQDPNFNEDINEEKKNSLKINLIDILIYLVQLESNAFLDFLFESSSNGLMAEGIINNLYYGDQGLQIQTGELLKYMIGGLIERKNEAMDIFSDKFLPTLMEHYLLLESNEKYYSFAQQFVELLIQCIRSHSVRMRFYIVHQKLLHKLYKGFQHREKSIHLAIIRFTKNVILSKVESLSEHICREKLMDDIFELYTKNAFRNNLISSACLDFFITIGRENIWKLIVESVERFQARIKEIGHEKFFKILLDKYDQLPQGDGNEETMQLPNGTILSISNELTERVNNLSPMERENMEEEEYFEVEEDEEEKENTNCYVEIIQSNGNSAEKEKSPFGEVFSPDQMTPTSPLSDENSKGSQDSLHKMKDKLATMRLEAEEDGKFILRNKNRNSTSSSDRNLAFQFNIESLNKKRPGSDLSSDEEVLSEGQMEPQKKIKF